MSVDWVQENLDSKRLLLVAHGLTGGSEMAYIQNTIEPFIKDGYRVGVIHNRGINKTKVITPRTHHFGSSDDFK